VADAIRSPTISEAMDACTPFLARLAHLVAILGAEAAPLSSYEGVFWCSRAALANQLVLLAMGSRQQLQASLGRRFKEFSNPLVVLAWWVDPFWAPVRSLLACILWGTNHWKLSGTRRWLSCVTRTRLQGLLCLPSLPVLRLWTRPWH